MRSSLVAWSSSRPITRPSGGQRKTCTVGWAPVQTTTTPGTGSTAVTPPVYPGGVQERMAPVVTFDAGMTVIDLDLDFLARRLGERGIAVDAAALERGAPAAWKRYDELNAAGMGHPWKQLMATLLAGAGVTDPEALAEWLWDEQPRRNLWRKPIAPMVELARELAARGV